MGARLIRLTCALAAAAALVWLDPVSAAHAQIGAPVENPELPTADGGRAFALKDIEANVLVFFRPNQERSVAALRDLARCQSTFSGKPVHWVGVVSGSAPLERATAMLRDAQLAATLLIDRGDQLYGSLGLALHPVVVIVGRDRKLAAFEPFRSVDFCAIVSARIRSVLHEISDDELREALAPAKSTQGGATEVARRYRALGERLLQDGQYDKALESARKGLEQDRMAAPVHALIGRIFMAQGNCGAAMPAFEQALAIQADNASAAEGLAQCKARP